MEVVFVAGDANIVYILYYTPNLIIYILHFILSQLKN